MGEQHERYLKDCEKYGATPRNDKANQPPIATQREDSSSTTTEKEKCFTIPPKMEDPGSFSILLGLVNAGYVGAMIDLGSSVSIMPYSIAKDFPMEIKTYDMTLCMANQFPVKPMGVLENVMLDINGNYVLEDFVVMYDNDNFSMILGRPFMKTTRALVNSENDTIMFRILNSVDIYYRIYGFIGKYNARDIPNEYTEYMLSFSKNKKQSFKYQDEEENEHERGQVELVETHENSKKKGKMPEGKSPIKEEIFLIPSKPMDSKEKKGISPMKNKNKKPIGDSPEFLKTKP